MRRQSSPSIDVEALNGITYTTPQIPFTSVHCSIVLQRSHDSLFLLFSVINKNPSTRLANIFESSTFINMVFWSLTMLIHCSNLPLPILMLRIESIGIECLISGISAALYTEQIKHWTAWNTHKCGFTHLPGGNQHSRWASLSKKKVFVVCLVMGVLLTLTTSTPDRISDKNLRRPALHYVIKRQTE